MPLNDDETPGQAMKRIESEVRGTADAQRNMYGYSANIGAQAGPLSGMVMSSGDMQAGNPTMRGVRGSLGPVSFTHVQPSAPVRPTRTVGVNVPFDADAYFGVSAGQSPSGRQYGVELGKGDFNAYGSYNPSRRDLNAGFEFRRNFETGGPVRMQEGGEAPPLTIYRKAPPPSAPLGGVESRGTVERPVDYAATLQAYQDAQRMLEPTRNMPPEGSLTARNIAAQLQPPEEQNAVSPSVQGVEQGARSVASGFMPAVRSIGQYLQSTSEKPDPSQVIAQDIANLGKSMYHGAIENPAEFIGGMLPGIGNLYALKDISEIKDKIQEARAAGDEEAAQRMEKALPLAAAGAIMPVGAGAATRGAVKGVEREAARVAEQAISSADTSIKQVPALFKSKNFEGSGRNLDIGGGKYDLGTDYLRTERGVENHVYDPFNRSEEHNASVLAQFKDNPADTVTAANVLNVIAEPEARAGVIQQAYDNLQPGGKAYFDIYEGNRTGEGTRTSKGWQNNLKADAYLDEVRKVFPDAERKGSMIIATKPAEEAAAGALKLEPQPIAQAFDNVPDPTALRDSIVDELTRSIQESDGAKAALPSTTMGLGPMYIVDSGVEGLKKKDGFLLNETKNRNAAKQLAGITPLLEKYPDIATNPESWAKAFAEATGNPNVVAPPFRFMKELGPGGDYETIIRNLTEGQIADRNHGFANGKKFLQAYTSGQMDVADTGKLFMWGILSRGVDPYTHEALFLDAFKGIEPWVKMAAEGKFTKEVAEGPYRQWAATTAPQGSGQAGAGAMHNLNAFGRDFLTKMGTPGADGITPMQKLHDMMSNPELTGRDIRRAFAETGEGVGIDNKVVSFVLLATGRDDVMVIDRIQLKNLWDDGRFNDINVWDGVSVPVIKLADKSVTRFPPTEEGRAQAKAFKAQNPGSKSGNAAVTGSSLAEATYGAKGILVYEALEDAIMQNVADLYKRAGRTEANPTPGMFHWDTWVARSNQEASHGTLGSILEERLGNPEPLKGVMSKQGDYQRYEYGAKYGVGPQGGYYNYPLSDGTEVLMTPSAFKDFIKEVQKPKNKVVPKDFLVSETVGGPWYEREGVNRANLDELARRFGGTGGQAGPVRRAAGGPVSDGAGDGAGGRGAGLNDLLFDVAHRAARKNMNVRQLSMLIKLATGADANWSHNLAGHLVSGNATAIRLHAERYPKVVKAIARLDEMLGGTKWNNVVDEHPLEGARVDHDMVKTALEAGSTTDAMKHALRVLLEGSEHG